MSWRGGSRSGGSNNDNKRSFCIDPLPLENTNIFFAVRPHLQVLMARPFYLCSRQGALYAEVGALGSLTLRGDGRSELTLENRSNNPQLG